MYGCTRRSSHRLPPFHVVEQGAEPLGGRGRLGRHPCKPSVQGLEARGDGGLGDPEALREHALFHAAGVQVKEHLVERIEEPEDLEHTSVPIVFGFALVLVEHTLRRVRAAAADRMDADRYMTPS